MPDVTGKKLDDAKRAIKDAGVDDDVKVEGGGVFGIVVESNWEVCEQNPAAGTAVSDKPTLTVARSCGTRSEEPETTTSETATSETATTTPAAPPAVATLTAKNNKALAAVLVAGDGCETQNVEAFAKKYRGRIAFDGSIVDATLREGKDTRWDIFIGAGDDGPNTAKGPNFQFRDVNMFDLQPYALIPNAGEKFRFIAEVGEFIQEQCAFLLEPVKTLPR